MLRNRYAFESSAIRLKEDYIFINGTLVNRRRIHRITVINWDNREDYSLKIVNLQNLRQLGVVGKFVEFFGPGCANLSIADRATIANMCPEYGATVGFVHTYSRSGLPVSQSAMPVCLSATASQ